MQLWYNEKMWNEIKEKTVIVYTPLQNGGVTVHEPAGTLSFLNGHQAICVFGSRLGKVKRPAIIDKNLASQRYDLKDLCVFDQQKIIILHLFEEKTLEFVPDLGPKNIVRYVCLLVDNVGASIVTVDPSLLFGFFLPQEITVNKK